MGNWIKDQKNQIKKNLSTISRLHVSVCLCRPLRYTSAKPSRPQPHFNPNHRNFNALLIPANTLPSFLPDPNLHDRVAEFLAAEGNAGPPAPSHSVHQICLEGGEGCSAKQQRECITKEAAS